MLPARRTPITELDGIRGLAIALVLLWHYFVGPAETTIETFPAYLVRALGLTWAGVDLFFVLSGFLVGGGVLDAYASPGFLRRFFVRRASRILPLYYLLLVALALIGLVAGPSDHAWNDWQHWLFGNPMPGWSYALLVQNFAMADSGAMGANWLAATWSLATEAQFYLALPLLVRLIPPTSLPQVLLMLALTAPVFRTVLYFSHPGGGLAAHVLLPGRLDALLLGVLGAWAWRQPAIVSRLRASLSLIRGTLAGAAIVAIGLMALSSRPGALAMCVFGYSNFAIGGLALILLALLSDGGVAQRVFRQPQLVWLGTVSYGVYLIHLPVEGLVHGWLRNQPPRMAGPADFAVSVLALVCTFALAQAFAVLLERPIVAAARRL